MTIDRVILENFLTYESLDYEIPKQPLLVQGRNLTEDDQESNGSGKSGIFTAIEFCITASNSRDVRDSELIMFGYDESNIQLYVSCNVRKESLHISWKIKLKGSNQLVLKKRSYSSDKWVEVSFSNVNDGKKYIMEWFAIEKEDLFNYYIINKTRFKSFFKSSNREKVELINRFSDISIIDGLEDISSQGLLDEKSKIEAESSKILGKIEIIEESIEIENNRDLYKEKREIETKILEEIEDYEDEIERLNEEIVSINLLLKLTEPKVAKINQEVIEVEKLKLPIAKERIRQLNMIRDVEVELNKAEALVTNFKTTDWIEVRSKDLSTKDKLKEELNKVLQEKGTLESQEKKAKELLKEVQLILSGIIVCPNCSHEFVLNEDISVEQAREKEYKLTLIKDTITFGLTKNTSTVEQVEEQLKKVDSSLSLIISQEEQESKERQVLRESVNSISNKLLLAKNKLSELKTKESNIDDEIKELKNEIVELEKKDVQYKKDIENINKDIESTKKQITVSKNSLKSIEITSNEEKIASLNKTLEELKLEQINIGESFNSITDKINKNNQWALNFKQFRMFLANQSLETIEFHCNRYLAEMKSDLQIKMEGYKLLADGSIKDEITARIIRNTERSFSSFSGGEQGRLLFATILANRYMIDKSHKYGGLDFLSIDEVFEGVDAIGLKHLIEAAKLLDIAVMIITHVTDKDTSEDILLIEKINGISQIKK